MKIYRLQDTTFVAILSDDRQAIISLWGRQWRVKELVRPRYSEEKLRSCSLAEAPNDCVRARLNELVGEGVRGAAA